MRVIEESGQSILTHYRSLPCDIFFTFGTASSNHISFHMNTMICSPEYYYLILGSQNREVVFLELMDDRFL